MAQKARQPKPRIRQQNESRDLLVPISSKPPPISFSFIDLPAEIQNMIYMEAFGGKRIHLFNMVHQFGNLRHCICPDDIPSHSNCFGEQRTHHVLVKIHVAHLEIDISKSEFSLSSKMLSPCRFQAPTPRNVDDSFFWNRLNREYSNPLRM